MDTIKTIKTALTHAEFKDPDIKAATDKLLTKLGDELDAVGYDAGSEVEEAGDEVDAAITNYEVGLEDAPNGVTGNSDDVDPDDPFAGLEEEEEDKS